MIEFYLGFAGVPAKYFLYFMEILNVVLRIAR